MPNKGKARPDEKKLVQFENEMSSSKEEARTPCGLGLTLLTGRRF